MRAEARRGIIYSSIALMLFSILVILAVSQSLYLNAGERTQTAKIASDSMRSFITTVERDYDKALDVSSRRAIVSTVNYVTNGTPLTSAEGALEELVMNGTIDGSPAALMENSTIYYWLARMQDEGNAAGLDVSLSLADFSVEEYDPFSLRMNTTISLIVSSPATRSQLSRTMFKASLVSIENFTDPYYTYKTSGLAPRTVSRAPYTLHSALLSSGSYGFNSTAGTAVVALTNAAANAVSNKTWKILVTTNGSAINSTVSAMYLGIVAEVNGTTLAKAYVTGVTNATNNITNGTLLFIDATSKAVWNKSAMDELDGIVTNTYYIPSADGPSFLDRLELRDSLTRTYGLESLVSLPELSDKGLTVCTNSTAVDYLYFNCSIAGKTVRGLYYTWLAVDSAHESAYGVTEGSRTLTN